MPRNGDALRIVPSFGIDNCTPDKGGLRPRKGPVLAPLADS